MTDSVDRLYKAIVAAKELDPGVSRTARLLRRGQAKMAKKLAEEAIEVVIDAMKGDGQAVVRESADLIYNLAVALGRLGRAPAGHLGRDGPARAAARYRREIAEIPGRRNMPAKPTVSVAKPAAAMAARRQVVALDTRRAPKRR